jgi:UDP-N-acetylmuramyl pentapeptide phosphotransferase/UDP-N-acetylglucosamine-1-phosphate transferase
MSSIFGFAIALVLIPVARRLAFATGLLDRPSDPSLAIHVRPVPVLGGPAVVAGALVAARISGDAPAAGVVAAVVLALAAGLADDMRQLSPVIRLVLLGGAGVVLAMEVGVEPLGALAGVATVALTLSCANATNLLDGQNGLAGGLVAIAAAALAAIAAGGSPARALGLGLAGAIAGFLIWNLPGRIFLGNGGAYALGTMLAALAAQVATTEGWPGVLAAAACLGVPALEMILTILRRLRSGASLTSGDRFHLYDIVADRTSRTRSTAVFWAAGAAAAGVGLWAANSSTTAAVAVVAIPAFAAIALAARVSAGASRSASRIGE